MKTFHGVTAQRVVAVAAGVVVVGVTLADLEILQREAQPLNEQEVVVEAEVAEPTIIEEKVGHER